MFRSLKRQILAVALAGLLAACGGGGGGGGGDSGGGGVIVGGGGQTGGGGGTGGGGTGGGGTGGGSGGGTGGGTPSGAPPTTSEAARLLTQATFGPTTAAVNAVVSSGSVSAWVNSQIAMPPSSPNHLDAIEEFTAVYGADTDDFRFSWLRLAITGQDQLRQRVAFALSQIFVISLNDAVVTPKGAASYYDMLTRDAFGNFRTLLEDVTLHPMMGRYLTFLGNEKEYGTRSPDENYAREVMQLMTIGLHELNADGTPRLSNGQPIPTYTSDDVSGLAKVFTGFGYYHPAPVNGTFKNALVPESFTRPMIFYPTYHSTSEKKFLGTTIPGRGGTETNANVASDLKIALDRLFNHPNTGPFIVRQLIQQLVTSNPTPAYVGRVAAVFANNGSGVRGDLGAVVRAILTDDEARNMSAALSSPSFGKVREPLIRFTNWARAFNARADSEIYMVNSTASNTSLGQAPLTAPSVFNFWRPGFTPPATTQLGQRNLVAPEFQIVDEVTVAAYANQMQEIIYNGIGEMSGSVPRDLQPNYDAEIAIANNASSLADRMNQLLFYGQMSTTLRDRIIAGINTVNIPSSGQSAIDNARLNRVRIAILLSMISPEYLVQR